MGVPTVQSHIVVIKGSKWDEDPQAVTRITNELKLAEEIWKLKFPISSWDTIDSPEMRYPTVLAKEDLAGQQRYDPDRMPMYTPEATAFLNRVGSNSGVTLIYINSLPHAYGITVSRDYAGEFDDIRVDGAFIAWKGSEDVATHELGHVLTGIKNPMHVLERNGDIMGMGGTNFDEQRIKTSAPWKDKVRKGRHVEWRE